MAKKLTAKSKPSNSTSGKLAAMQAAIAGDVNPPAHSPLPKRALPFWRSIIDARPRQLWYESDLENAVQLAKIKSDIVRFQNRLDREGPVIKKGDSFAAHPLIAVVETLSRRAMSLSRMLHVHAEAIVGYSRNAKSKLDGEREAAEALSNTHQMAKAGFDKIDSDLIPTMFRN